MPLGLSGEEFGPECNVVVFARKIQGGIFRCPRNKFKKFRKKKKKKTSSKFCTKIPLGPSSQEFGLECNVAVFVRELVGGI